MKANLKIAVLALCGAFVAAVLLVAGCPTGTSGAGGNGGGGGKTATITLNLPGAAAQKSSSERAAYPPPPAILAQLSFTVTFTNGPSADTTVTAPPGQSTVRVSIMPGTWQIKTQAFLNNKLYAEGVQTETLKAGDNGATMLDLHNAGMVGIVFKYQDGRTPDSSDTVLQGSPVMRPSFPASGVSDFMKTLIEGKLYDTSAGGNDSFGGWYDAAGTTAWNFSNPVTDDMILYAKWVPDPGNVIIPLTVPNGSNIVAEALNYITMNPGYYELVLDDTPINNVTAGMTYNNVIVNPPPDDPDPGSFTLRANSPRAIRLGSGSGSIFTILGGDMILENITLAGNAANLDELVSISGGSFTLKSGGITNNSNTNNGAIGGAGVFISGTGIFYMMGGTISENTAGNITFYTPGKGAGVYVASGGTFYMYGGTITRNIAYADTSTGGSGGGVYVDGIFEMTGGTISANTTRNGGGVYVGPSGTFTKTGGGTISGNTAIGAGNAVYVETGSFFRNSTAGPGDNLPPWN